MGIKIRKLYNVESYSIRSFESVSDELILINLDLKSDSLNLDSRPFHYRYDFGDFPPLDISFDSETGLLKEITLFVNKSDLSYKNQEEKFELLCSEGYPCANTDFLIKHDYYYDEICKMKLSISDSSLSVNQSDRLIHKKIVVNEDLNILIDDSEEIVGLVINNLSAENITLFK